MYTKMREIRKREMFAPLVRTFSARGMSALGSLILIISLGQLYGPVGAGIFAFAQSIYIGSCILARYGMDNTLMRYVGEDHTSDAIKSYLQWAITKASYLSLIAALLVYFLRGGVESWFNAPGLEKVLVGISLTIPAFTLSYVLAGFMKGIRKPATACLLENGSISFIAAGIMFLLEVFDSNNISNAGWAMAIAAWLVLAQGFWQLRSWFLAVTLNDELYPIDKKKFTSSSHSFFILSLANFLQQVVGILVAGWLLGSEDLGLFRSAERTAYLISFILLVINAVLPPRFASLYKQKNLIGLNTLARKGALLGIALASPMLLICLVAPGWILSLFGPEFIKGENLLRIIALAQMLNVATGSVGLLLNMTGYEKLMRNIAILTNALGLALFFVLIPLYGTWGAALALSSSLVIQNFIALFYVWRKLGIWMLPIPNVFKVVGIKCVVR